METLDILGRGPFTPAMATTAGVTRDRLRHLVAHGVVRPLLRGVYVATATPDSIDLRAQAAGLVLPEHAVVCDLCAAWLHGIDLLAYAEQVLVPDLDIVSVAGHEGSRRRGVLGGKRTLLPEDVMEVHGIRVTTPLRTACDVARLRGRLRAMAALDEFRRAFAISEAELLAVLPRFAGQRGVIQLRELIPLSTDQADSQPESWVRLMIHDEGLPLPQPQVWSQVPGWGRVRTENAYPHLRIVVEYDGEEFHTSADDREHDALRRAALREHDWVIIVIGKDDLGARARLVWLAELAAAIHDRAPEARVKRIYSRGPDEPSYAGRRRRRR